MKISKSTILIIIISLIDCVVGYTVISKCFFNQEVKNEIKYEPKVEVMEDVTKMEPLLTEEIVYDNMTLTELTEKLDRYLSSNLSGMGMIFATKSLELGVDPYLAVAISMHETGCKWGCSKLTRQCNNVGGMKGSPSCGNGSYRKFDTLEEGITKFIENIANNYYDYGLTTPEAMNHKYAASKTWATKVNKYINEIKKA